MKIIRLGCAPHCCWLVPGLAGCGGSSSPAVNSPGLVPRSVSATLSNGLTATLTEDRSAVAVGSAVTYTATLTNATAQPITYQPVLSGTNSFSGANALTVPAALVVSSPSGQTVYPTGPIPLFAGVGAAVTLTPGQSVSAVQTVTTTKMMGLAVTQGYAASGTYTAKAYFSVIPGAALNAAPAAVSATAGPLPVTAQ